MQQAETQDTQETQYTRTSRYSGNSGYSWYRCVLLIRFTENIGKYFCHNDNTENALNDYKFHDKFVEEMWSGARDISNTVISKTILAYYVMNCNECLCPNRKRKTWRIKRLGNVEYTKNSSPFWVSWSKLSQDWRVKKHDCVGWYHCSLTWNNMYSILFFQQSVVNFHVTVVQHWYIMKHQYLACS